MEWKEMVKSIWHHTWQQTFPTWESQGWISTFLHYAEGYSDTDNLDQNHIDTSRAVPFDPLEPEHLNLLMSIAPMDSSSTHSRTGSSLAENTDSPIPELWPVQFVCRHDTRIYQTRIYRGIRS
jgi:5'-3' exonuclease